MFKRTPNKAKSDIVKELGTPPNTLVTIIKSKKIFADGNVLRPKFTKVKSYMFRDVEECV